NGVAVPNALVTFNGPGGTALGFGKTNASGVATAPVTFATPGAITVTATATATGSACNCRSVVSAPVTVTVQQR
ncbi:hypothetical protein ACWIGO_31265, partial [Streptomyces kronopolitis]